jgi:GTPase SAR1 family protein
VRRMGACGVGGACARESDSDRDERRRTRAIERSLSKADARDSKYEKLLLLGAGGSGKSTVFKQVQIIHGKGYSELDRQGFAGIIRNNVLQAITTLGQNCSRFGGALQNPAALKVVETLPGDETQMDESLGELIANLWRDAGIQIAYANRSKFQLSDSSAYFLEKVREIAQADYLPTQEDILRMRVRTTGIVEMNYEMKGGCLKIMDVGGQRNERKKWLHCFERVTAVLFIAAISEYDEFLYEDETVPRFEETFNLFNGVVNSPWFAKTSFILFLNKSDILEQKLKAVPFAMYQPDYKGDNSFLNVVEYLKKQFRSRFKQTNKQCYMHVTCATDTNNIATVFDAVRAIIFRQHLTHAAMMG